MQHFCADDFLTARRRDGHDRVEPKVARADTGFGFWQMAWGS